MSVIDYYERNLWGNPLSRIEVEGMHRLQGEVAVQGSKNAVLPILSACVLNEGETVLHGCPKIRDVSSMLEALECAGAKIRWEGNTLILDTSVMHSEPFIEKAGCMRSSVMLLGSFLGRFGRATLGYPGGCRIGKRPIDLHEQTLNAMGVIFCEEEDYLEARCRCLEGCDLYLPYPSVGVTENILLAAAKASGMTRIYGAAREPEITELCKFLSLLGVRIGGIGTDRLSVMGGKLKKHVEYQICTDRIVAGTYLFAVAATGGDVILKNAPLTHMKSTIQTIGSLGAALSRSGNDVRIQMKGTPKALKYLRTAPYPEFPTDLQSPLLAVLCKADGYSKIEERIFENRFLIVKELRKMGADVTIEGRCAYISPVEQLTGSNLEAPDLRGGAALVIAAMEAEGKSVIENAKVIFRGYEKMIEDFYSLGADIRTIS